MPGAGRRLEGRRSGREIWSPALLARALGGGWSSGLIAAGAEGSSGAAGRCADLWLARQRGWRRGRRRPKCFASGRQASRIQAAGFWCCATPRRWQGLHDIPRRRDAERRPAPRPQRVRARDSRSSYDAINACWLPTLAAARGAAAAGDRCGCAIAAAPAGLSPAAKRERDRRYAGAGVRGRRWPGELVPLGTVVHPASRSRSVRQQAADDARLDTGAGGAGCAVSACRASVRGPTGVAVFYPL